MPQLRRASPDVIRAFLEAQSQLSFSYAAVGATATTPPARYTVDHSRVLLGNGEAVFYAAIAALSRWEHFRLGWVEAHPQTDKIKTGATVAVVARIFGLSWLNACRIVYVVDDVQPPFRRWGFAYGTLPGHAESGEERFMIEWDQTTGEVWYDIIAFSRPRHVLARLGYPVTRQFQKRFARDSAAAMVRAVASAEKN
jgi:uncharacterized protein (UPF0548 family)